MGFFHVALSRHSRWAGWRKYFLSIQYMKKFNLRFLEITAKFFGILGWVLLFSFIAPIIGLFWYLYYQDNFNIGTLTLIEQYDNRQWKALYDYEGHLWGDGKITKKELNSSWYFWPYNVYNHLSWDSNNEYIFFTSGTTLKVLSKWHEYRESSNFMDEWTDLDIYLVQDESWRKWTTNDFNIDYPTNP